MSRATRGPVAVGDQAQPQITQRQLEVLEALVAFTAEHHYQPTAKELGEIMGLHYRTVADHLMLLCARGVVERRGQRAITLNFSMDALRARASEG